MAKFNNAVVGERVWSSIHGWGKIIGVASISPSTDILVAFDDSDYHLRAFYYDGRLSKEDKYPTLFWNDFHIPTDEEDKKTFDLVEFFRENLKPKEFVLGETNYYLEYSQGLGWSRGFEDEWYIMGCVYFDDDITNVVKELTEHEITSEEVIQAFKTLGWINF